MSHTLEIRALHKSFGRVRVLRDVSFSILEGEVLGLIGPNGSGKTTLLECLAGLQFPDGGTVSIDAAALHPGERRRRLYYMPDSIRPWPDQRLDWILRFFGGLYRRPPAESLALAHELGLSGVLTSCIGALSKGEMKRVLLALALLTPHPLLLLDEPFDGLDYRQTRDAMAVLRGPRRQGRTLFLSIHQLTDAARICDRFVLLSRGEVAGEGTLDDLRSKASTAGATLEEIFLALT